MLIVQIYPPIIMHRKLIYSLVPVSVRHFPLFNMFCKARKRFYKRICHLEKGPYFRDFSQTHIHKFYGVYFSLKFCKPI